MKRANASAITVNRTNNPRPTDIATRNHNHNTKANTPASPANQVTNRNRSNSSASKFLSVAIGTKAITDATSTARKIIKDNNSTVHKAIEANNSTLINRSDRLSASTRISHNRPKSVPTYRAPITNKSRNAGTNPRANAAGAVKTSVYGRDDRAASSASHFRFSIFLR
jgi:hypothetical protein